MAEMTQIIEFDGKLYELNTAAISYASLFPLRDQYEPPKDWSTRYATKALLGSFLPNYHAIINAEDTDRMERQDRKRKAMHRLPKRLRNAFGLLKMKRLP